MDMDLEAEKLYEVKMASCLSLSLIAPQVFVCLFINLYLSESLISFNLLFLLLLLCSFLCAIHCFKFTLLLYSPLKIRFLWNIGYVTLIDAYVN